MDIVAIAAIAWAVLVSLALALRRRCDCEHLRDELRAQDRELTLLRAELALLSARQEARKLRRTVDARRAADGHAP